MNTSKHRFVEFLELAGERPYRKLVRHNMDRLRTHKLAGAALAETSTLPSEMQPLAAEFIDKTNSELGLDQEFWANASCKEAYSRILGVAQRTFGSSIEAGSLLQNNPELAFGLFQLATVSFAYSASKQPAQQKFMGILRRRFPIWSTLGLLYALGAFAHYISLATPAAAPAEAIGYCIAQIGYVLLVSGIISGQFRVFGLRGRLKVIGMGLAVVLLGAVISNL